MALVSATPGTSTIKTLMVTVSRLTPSPSRTSSSDISAPTALQTAVRKKLLEPVSRRP